MSVNDFTNWINEKNGSLTVQEREIGELTGASIDMGIISEYEHITGNYFRMKMGDREYEVCFGHNPDKKQHPRAERAIRASEFVSALLGAIDGGFTCFVAPSVNIEAPYVTTLKARIFGDSARKYRADFLGDGDIMMSSYESHYELDVVISVMVGDRYKRIVDSLAVRHQAQDGKHIISYRHEKLVRRATDDAKLRELYDKGAYSTADLGFILDAIRGVNHDGTQSAAARGRNKGESNSLTDEQQNENKMKILEALCESEDSNFYKFLKECDNNSVGQIRVRPSSIFVDAVTQKVFTCEIRYGNEKKTFSLTLEWNRSKEDFNKSTPLYLVVENGVLRGLTYNATDEEGNAREPFGDGDRIVVAHKARGGKTEPYALSLLLPESYKNGGVWSCPESYKGVRDYAISVADATEGYDASAAYAVSQTVDIGGVRYIKDDCQPCEYSGVTVWRGSLTEANYIDAQGVMHTGLIDTSASQYQRKCQFCKTVFYADAARHKKYFQNRPVALLAHDVSTQTYCEFCPTYPKRKDDAFVIGDERMLVYPGVESVHGPLDVIDRANVEQARAIVKCSDCSRLIYYSEAYERDHSYNRCGCCDRVLCKTCFGKIKTEEGTGLKLCPTCLKHTQGNAYQELLSAQNQSAERYRLLNSQLRDAREEYVHGLEAEIAENLHQHVALMRFSDRGIVLREIRKKKLGSRLSTHYQALENTHIEVTGSSIGYDAASARATGKDNVAAYTITVYSKNNKSRIYHFTRVGKKIRLEGIGYGTR